MNKTKRVSKQHLKNEYLVNGKSCKTIANELGVAGGTVHKWLIFYHIPRRPQGEYPRSLEWRQRMSNAKLKISNWAGENNPNWKGGISAVKHGERAVGTVKSWRHWVKVRDDWICKKCGKDGKITCLHCGEKPRMHADHIKPWKDYPELRFDIANGRTLCENCHIRKIA